MDRPDARCSLAACGCASDSSAQAPVAVGVIQLFGNEVSPLTALALAVGGAAVAVVSWRRAHAALSKTPMCRPPRRLRPLNQVVSARSRVRRLRPAPTRADPGSRPPLATRFRGLAAPDLPQRIDQRREQRIGGAVREMHEPELGRDLRSLPDHAAAGVDGLGGDLVADEAKDRRPIRRDC